VDLKSNLKQKPLEIHIFIKLFVAGIHTIQIENQRFKNYEVAYQIGDILNSQQFSPSNYQGFKHGHVFISEKKFALNLFCEYN